MARINCAAGIRTIVSIKKYLRRGVLTGSRPFPARFREFEKQKKKKKRKNQKKQKKKRNRTEIRE
jgi:hypothetical protein